MKLRSAALVTVAALLALASGRPVEAQTETTGVAPGGAHYIIQMPDSWNGSLAIWNHGFDLDPIGPLTSDDAGPLSPLQTTEGYAVAASSYRQTGWALFDSDRDLEELVAAFEAQYGVPDEVLLVGASLGGIVTASALERADLGNVTGAYTICGAMAGSRNWDGALDMRLIYDYVCKRPKKARIAGGAKGLEKNSSLSEKGVEKAVNKCFGLNRPADKRKKKQKKRLARFLELTQIPEEFVQTNMGYVTFGMADLVHDPTKLEGRPGAGNKGVDYGDSDVNKKIERVKPKKNAARNLARNYTPSGQIGGARIVSMHTSGDGLVLVENQREYAEVVPAQNLTVGIAVEDEPSHCGFTLAEVVGGWEALRTWLSGEPQPTAADLQSTCELWTAIFPGPCRIDPGFEIPDLDARVPAR